MKKRCISRSIENHAVKEPIFITKNGYGDLVVMSIETYEQIVETQTIDNAISEAEEEYKATDILLDARETLASLRRKHFRVGVRVIHVREA